MSTALIILFPGFEEIEAISTIDVLRRGGIGVTMAALDGEKNITGAHHITCVADVVGIPTEEFDAIIIPGGAGVLRLRHNTEIKNLIRKQYESGKLVAAICAAPILLHDLEILDKHRHTAHFSMKDELKDAQVHELTVVDGNIITGCGPAGGINFALAILEYLVSIAVVREVAHGIMCDREDKIV
ncbi:MAG: DJ-1/PfpI family protein [Puniceicoccales bacterium]|jgi:4-methyl-5(b-hydroxyethyl)-thiazole monophosphate biosynthesis|nr:DJ-1/PfpI family protein [Puniceicoccales bacterium]